MLRKSVIEIKKECSQVQEQEVEIVEDHLLEDL